MMKGVTTLTSKGQVTIPKEIRDALGLRPHDKIRFVTEGGEGRFQKAYPSLEEVVGSIPAIDIPMEEWDDIIQDEVVQQYAEENQ